LGGADDAIMPFAGLNTLQCGAPLVLFAFMREYLTEPHVGPGASAFDIVAAGFLYLFGGQKALDRPAKNLRARLIG
jgi:hypothetical protein